MGCVKDVLNSPVTTAVTDIALAGTGNAEFIPVANAAESTAAGVSSGESFGKAAGQGAISGAEALGAQELAGAVGVGDGNTAFNNALGITGDNPAGTGLPDIGNLFSAGSTATGGAAIDANTGLPSSAESTNTAGATINSATGATVAAPSASTSVNPTSGGGPISAGSVGDFSSNAVNANLGGDISGASTGSSPNLGSVGASADSALKSAGTDAIGSTAGGFTSNLTSPTADSIVAGTSPGTSSVATPTAASTGGLSDWLPAKADVGKAALSGAIPLGTAAYEAIKGPGALPTAAQPLAANGAVTGPLISTETSQANAFNTGTLTAPQQATIDQGVQQQENELLQQLASSGVTNPQGDSRYIAGMQQIQQWATTQKNAILQQDITNAFSAAGAAGTNLGTVANAQVQNDTAYQQALAAAMQAIGGTVTKAA